MLVHGSNLSQKENHKTKYRDKQSRQYLIEVREQYNKWYTANEQLIGPNRNKRQQDQITMRERVRLLTEYKDFLDQQHYAEQFDSRSNLHSSVLEEFLYYLFRDLVADFGQNALLGKSHTFKDIFFVPTSYHEMVNRAHAQIERKDHDFVIGVTVSADLNLHTTQNERTGTTAPHTETHLFDIAAVAIECKTYLDKTMLEGSSRAAEQLKARNPNAMYIVLMEWLKLTSAVNLRKYEVDQIYVLRKQKNTDREFRFVDEYNKNPIDSEVVWHLYENVRDHLTTDWEVGIEQGLQRGWLL